MRRFLMLICDIFSRNYFVDHFPIWKHVYVHMSEYRYDICPHIPKAGITLIILIASHGNNSITGCNAICDDYQIKFDI